MVEVNEIYEFQTCTADWNNIVSKFQSDMNAGKETVIDRIIAGESVRCVVTGYTWNNSKKPFKPMKQKIKVQVTEIISPNQASDKANN